MSIHDDDRPGDDGVYQSSTPGRQKSRRTRIAVGAAGAVAVLGAGAYLVTAQATDRDSGNVAQEAGVGSPEATAAMDSVSIEPSVSAAPSTPASPSATAATTTAKAAEKTDPKVRKQIDEARAKAEKDGFPLKRPVTGAAGAKAASGQVNERTERTAEGAVRVVSAKFDLTGQRELALAADNGFAAGDARCTHRVRFSVDDVPEDKPSMLLCWRTSDSRSVVTLAVASNGKPGTANSVAVLDKEWSKLG